MNITITKLERPEHHGDWHDKPTRWAVHGPGTELQKFSTKAEAMLWKRIRKASPDFKTASTVYSESPTKAEVATKVDTKVVWVEVVYTQTKRVPVKVRADLGGMSAADEAEKIVAQMPPSERMGNPGGINHSWSYYGLTSATRKS